ncbi:MAG: hypothetical protein GEEBNDBF_01815 [bacterium]|nr:hypothetical protein [bacterium]
MPVPATELPVIGWREWVLFPDLHLSPLQAKIDTGARTSALHASDIEIAESPSGRVVRFLFHPFHRHPEIAEPAEAPLVSVRIIRSSSGHAEERPVIQTALQLGAWLWPIELTLTPRPEMGFRLLLGREAIRGRFLVDPGHSYLLSKRPRRISRRSRPEEPTPR